MGYKAIFAIVIAMTCEIAIWIVQCKWYEPIFSEIAFTISITVCERASTYNIDETQILNKMYPGLYEAQRGLI